jgi:hypothetical protein
MGYCEPYLHPLARGKRRRRASSCLKGWRQAPLCLLPGADSMVAEGGGSFSSVCPVHRVDRRWRSGKEPTEERERDSKRDGGGGGWQIREHDTKNERGWLSFYIRKPYIPKIISSRDKMMFDVYNSLFISAFIYCILIQFYLTSDVMFSTKLL